MRTVSARFLAVSLLLVLRTPRSSAQSAPPNGGDFSQSAGENKVPAGVILVKGAWSSASDSVTPVPDGGNVVNHVFRDEYFGMTYALPPDWTEKYKGPPPSDGAARPSHGFRSDGTHDIER